MMDKHVDYIAQAAKGGAQITCLQEIFYGPYFCAEQETRWYDLTEPIPDGPTIKLMQDLARQHHMSLVVPIYELEQEGVYYNTAGVIPAIKPGMSIRDRARATIEAGYRAYRMGAADVRNGSTFNTRERLNQVLKDCQEAREGVGENGDFCIDFHQSHIRMVPFLLWFQSSLGWSLWKPVASW